jgi:hypothetical protein
MTDLEDFFGSPSVDLDFLKRKQVGPIVYDFRDRQWRHSQ